MGCTLHCFCSNLHDLNISFTGPNGRGIWKVILKPHAEGGPYNITATQMHNGNVTDEVTLQDVLFGEVWLCSGQSNMQMALVVVRFVSILHSPMSHFDHLFSFAFKFLLFCCKIC